MRVRLWAAVGALGLLAAIAISAWPQAREGGEQALRGGCYLTVIKDAQGNFASRSLITLHADRTMLAVDSGQQGPLNYFSSQLGVWRPAGNLRIAGRTLDFLYPPGSGMARARYEISFAPGWRRMSGTITVWSFPLESANPLEDEGTLVGTFNFEGERIEP